MPEPDLELDEISTLFAEAAVALRAAQESLDPVRLPLPGGNPHDVLTYAVTRADFEINAELQRVNSKVVLFFKKRKQSEVDRHSMRFALLAVPDVPPAPDPSAMLSPPPPAPAPVPVEPFEFAQPPFLLTAPGERSVCGDLATLLRKAQPGDYEDKRPPDDPLTPEEVHNEGKLLAGDCDNTGFNSDDEPQPVAVYFRLDGAGPATLVVRALDNAADAGVYVYRPDSKPPVTIYSTHDDHSKSMPYEPIQLLLDALRAARGDTAVRREAHPAVDPQIGLKFLPTVMHAVWNGYIEALRRLQPPPTSPPGGTQRTFYDLPGVEAQLSYASPQLPRAADDGSGQRDDDETAVENHVIETRARLLIERRSGRPACTLSLDATEFVVTGAARDFLIGLILETQQVDEIARKLGEDAPEPYEEALRSEEMRRDAVILLISSAPIPKPLFMAVWPGRMASVVQDFMFRFELKVASDGSKLDNVKRVRRMQQAVQLVGGRVLQPDLEAEEYAPWHEFFKAVRRWRSRGEPLAG